MGAVKQAARARQQAMGRSTKIVATLGPASQTPACIDELLAAGVDVFRLNLSHGDLDEHLSRLALLLDRFPAAELRAR